MGTGYTYELDDNPELTTSQWVTEYLSRAFGVCVALRDGPHGLSDDEIEAYLEKEITQSTEYHREILDEAQGMLDGLEAVPEMWHDVYGDMVVKVASGNEQSVKKARVKKQRHEQVGVDLVKLRDDTVDEITRNIAQYGLDQLELCKSETEPYVHEIPTFEEFKERKLKSLKRDVEYHTEKIDKTQAREGKRVLSYRRIRYEVKRILEGKE